MKKLTKWILAALVPVAMVGCDPFEEKVTGPLALIGAGFTETSHGEAVEGTGAGSTWAIAHVPSVCAAANTVRVAGFIYVKFNKLLDGASIQTAPNNCTPAAALGLNVVVTGATIPVTHRWYACYNPQSPTPDEGASVMIFLGLVATPPAGWASASPIPVNIDTYTTVRATGTATDQEGQTAAFDVTAQIDPNPGTPGTPRYTNFNPAVNPTDWTVTWTAPLCATANTTYRLERAPNVPAGTPPVDASGTYADIATGLTATTFAQAGLTAGALYWYQVTASVSGTTPLVEGPTSAESNQKPVAPAAPTFTNFTATTLTVNWTGNVSAATYTVQRAPNVPAGTPPADAPGTWADLATGLPDTTLTYDDSGLTTGTKYWYRIIAVNPYGSANGAAAINSPVAPAAPTFTNLTATTLTVNWTATNNTASYTVQRAPNAPTGTPPVNAPGTWADIATGLTALTYDDAGPLTTGTVYWYRIVAVNPYVTTNGASTSVTTP